MPIVALALAAAQTVEPPANFEAEPRVWVEMLANGDFEATVEGADAERIPWWIETAAGAAIEREANGQRLVLSRRARVAQPFALYAPFACELILEGRVAGSGLVVFTDGAGGRVEIEVCSPGPELASFRVTGAELAGRLGRAPVPRLAIELGAARDDAVRLDDLRCGVALPCPAPAELRGEILTALEPIFGAWLVRGLDDVGARSTRFLCRSYDVVSGAPLAVGSGGIHALYEQLARLVRIEPRPEWRELLTAYVDDLIELGLHPDTGLPRRWDPAADAPLDDEFVEIARTLRFLMDLVEDPPNGIGEARRERCLDAAKRIAQTVLARGVLPDGEVAILYRASDALSSNAAPNLRKLDVAAQLARVGAATSDERLRIAALRCLSTWEYTHAWSGSAGALDPGFNDFYGNLAARSLTMWKAYPGEPLFPRLAVDGFDYFAPLWRAAVVHGRSASPDQVRCWEVTAEIARLVPERRREVDDLLDAALRSHFKGQQYDGGSWGGVAIFRYAPNVEVENGDGRGMPMNLLKGVALCHSEDLGPPRETTRALFTALMRSTRERYERPHGYLLTPTERTGANSSGGSVAFAIGLIEMLRGL